MRNLYSKKYSMNNPAKSRDRAKIILMFLISGISLFTYAFAQNRVYFSPSNIYPILNTPVVWTATDLQITTTAWVKSYWVDVYDQSKWAWQQHPNDKLSVTTNIWQPSITYVSSPNYWLNQYKNTFYAWVYAGFDTDSAAPYMTFSATSVGKLAIINSGTNYLTSAYVGYYTWVSSVTYVSLVGWAGNQSYDSLSWLNIYFRGCPATKDAIQPTFPNNQATYNTNPNFPGRQINRQYKNDFSWVFGLLDNSNTAPGSNGWISTPDFDAWSNFRPNATNWTDSSISNQNGINTWSFVLQIKVASGWNHSIPQTSRNNRSSQQIFTGNSNGVVLTGRGKTRRYRDKNYTWSINTSNISNFGVEQLVMISGYVEDRDMWYSGFNGTQTWNQIQWYSYRSGKNTTNFVYYFNQGMRPWFNTGTTSTSWSYTHTPTCAFDLVRYQTWMAIRTISGNLRDDWAGIDTSTVQIIVTGTVAGIQTGRIYTPGANLSLNNYSSIGTWCRTDVGTFWVSPRGNSAQNFPGDGTVVCDDGTKASTGNYTLTFSDTSRSYDPESPLSVSIVYQDNVGKQWRPVSCNRSVRKAPRFVWTGGLLTNTLFSWAFANLITLSNYPNGAQISPINIQLQDDRYGANTGSISWIISGSTLNSPTTIAGVNINLAYNTNVYTQVWGANLWSNTWYPNYYDRLSNNINSIPSFQTLNYELLFAQTGNYSNFSWYFAPEQPINLTLTFNDKSWTVASNPINVTYTNNEAPKFWEYTKTTGFTDGSSQLLIWGDTPVGNYLTWEMANLFTGNSNSWENRIFPYDLTGNNISQLGPIKQTNIAFKTTDNRAGVDSGSIVLTITWNRRWMPYVYVFTASKLDFTAFDRWDTWSWNLLNYLSILSHHNIYFDRQSRWGNAPVPWRESRYTINISETDLKKPTPNSTNISFTRDMENLSCQYLDRCNARLYFTYDYGSWVVPVVQTWVHPFLWQTLYVIASWDKIIYTGTNENYIACNGAGTLMSPITIDFPNGLLVWWETDPYTNYQYSDLVVMDGMFEITGTTLVLK